MEVGNENISKCWLHFVRKVSLSRLGIVTIAVQYTPIDKRVPVTKTTTCKHVTILNEYGVIKNNGRQQVVLQVDNQMARVLLPVTCHPSGALTCPAVCLGQWPVIHRSPFSNDSGNQSGILIVVLLLLVITLDVCHSVGLACYCCFCVHYYSRHKLCYVNLLMSITVMRSDQAMQCKLQSPNVFTPAYTKLALVFKVNVLYVKHVPTSTIGFHTGSHYGCIKCFSLAQKDDIRSVNKFYK